MAIATLLQLFVILSLRKFIHLKMSKNIDALLDQHQIRKTACRKDMLSHFYKKKYAISFPQLEKALKTHDRTSVFRNLIFFEEMGFIHKLSDSEGVVKYALCEEKCFGHQHTDEHIHFTCTNCNNTFCLDEKKLPEIRMPKGFFLESFSIIAKGICDKCGHKMNKIA